MLTRRLLVISTLAVVAFAADPVIGTWKLNTAKSKYIGMAAPKEVTIVYSPMGDGWNYEAKGISGDGQPTNMSFMYMKDNEDMKLTGYPNAETLTLKNGKTSASTGTFKRGGKPVGTAKRTVSKDGKTMTVEAHLTAPDGKKVSYTSVYDKQ